MQDPSIAGLPDPLNRYQEDDLKPALQHIIGMIRALDEYDPVPSHLLEEDAPILGIVDHIRKVMGNPNNFYTYLEQYINNFNAALDALPEMPEMPEFFGTTTAKYKPKRSKKKGSKKKRSKNKRSKKKISKKKRSRKKSKKR